jgi:hypothetical protein
VKILPSASVGYPVNPYLFFMNGSHKKKHTLDSGSCGKAINVLQIIENKKEQENCAFST